MERAEETGSFGSCDCGPTRRGTLDAVLAGLVRVSDHALEAENLATAPGFLQGLDPRAKLAGIVLLIVSATLVHSLVLLAALFALAVGLAIASHVSVGRLARQVWIGVLLFTGVIALPSPFIVPGVTIATIPGLGWTISEQGLRSAAFLIGRAETSATFALLLILTTRWPHVLKALRALGLPVALVAVLGMTHRYIFVLLTTATQMFEARRSRIMAPMNGRERRRIIVSGAGVLLSRTMALANDVHLAMVSRGYRGEVRLIDDFRFRQRDGIALALAAVIPAAILWVQR